MKPNSLKPIEKKSVTKEEEDLLRDKLSNYCERNRLFCTSTRSICKSYRAVYINGDTKLLLINPVVKKYGDERISSQEVSEFDTKGRKARTVIRATSIEVECDNLGTVLFSGDVKDNTHELNECIMVQQMIDLLDGFTIGDRNINQPIVNKKNYDRNELVLAKNAEGIIEHIKYKYIQQYIDKGYVIM